ncbi:MAG: ACT domain-containing protein, partial [Proteobacteria bacterium]|nr:ACT domain-containing protein [Pseudomonadota bacterium]
NLPRAEIIPAGSTSRAAELAAAEAGSAAIGPALAGELHDLPVLRARFHDRPVNRTRFFVLGRSPVDPSGKDKTSMVFSVAHKAGALHRALAILSNHQISMTFIQSHPTKETPWEYMFFVDVEGHAALSDLAAALEELRQQTSTLRVLGSYPESD